MANVSIQNVQKSYGPVEVIHGLDIEVEKGEFVVLVGPSGCGKSTLLRMIAGLETITEGSISIGGRVVNDVAPKDRDIAMVFQNYALYPQMNVAQNMSFALELAGESKEAIKSKVDAAASILGLNPLLDRKPAELSGGQRQRVAMGRAIVRDPQVFLFDEPLSNLDAKLRVQMRAEIKALHERLGTTIVYVTHDQVEAMTMADKIVVLNGGRVEQMGAPLELYDNPANEFVAGFLGSPSMNFLSGTYQDGKVVLESGAALSVKTLDQVQSGSKVRIGIRPENLKVQDAGELSADVVLIEPTGSETIVTAKIGEETINILVRDRATPALHGTISLSVDANDIHIFDNDTGSRIS